MNIHNAELEAGETLLDVGISLPLRLGKNPFTNRYMTVRVTMRRPKLGSIIRITRHYLKLGVTIEQMINFSKDEELKFIAKHGTRISKMVALTVCRGFITGILFMPIMAWLLRHFTHQNYLFEASLRFLTLTDTKDFIPIIRSASMLNPMRPTLSQKKKGS